MESAVMVVLWASAGPATSGLQHVIKTLYPVELFMQVEGVGFIGVLGKGCATRGSSVGKK